MRTLHHNPGYFDKGGNSRYSHYQILALRGIVGVENIRALSPLGPYKMDVVSPCDRAALVQLLTENCTTHSARSAEALKVAEERFWYEAFVDKHRTLRYQITRLS